jgi:hypothetical protein
MRRVNRYSDTIKCFPNNRNRFLLVNLRKKNSILILELDLCLADAESALEYYQEIIGK